MLRKNHSLRHLILAIRSKYGLLEYGQDHERYRYAIIIAAGRRGASVFVVSVAKAACAAMEIKAASDVHKYTLLLTVIVLPIFA